MKERERERELDAPISYNKTTQNDEERRRRQNIQKKQYGNKTNASSYSYLRGVPDLFVLAHSKHYYIILVLLGVVVI
jgi:hypothetical protein